ncbi:MAG: imidazole glycerol phosphate synthase cyclase subunit [Polaromonas sp.]|nr:imidazole glycerol phosphate synthase cyclase subunit [Polaromonas sp.]
MAGLRIIPRLDVKGANLIKGIRLEGLRVVGDPHEFALRYYADGADEIVFMDIVASLYQRNNLTDIIRRAADQIYIPITVGGGIRSLADVNNMLRSGADKVAINTAAIARPELISEISGRYGSQCMVLSVEAKKTGPGKWEAYTDNGREHTGLDVVDWVERAVKLGAGEIMLTAVDQEGTRKGLDIDLLKAVNERVNVPVIASGGFADVTDLQRAHDVGTSAVAIADALHWKRMMVGDIKRQAQALGLEVRL